MWGTLLGLLTGLLQGRFIPTHVGNTGSSRSRRHRLSVHPHACGEHLIPKRSMPWMIGSSPRMWGTLKAGCPKDGIVRFIPTHVGNTDEIRMSEFLFSVHPHACGEHSSHSSRVRSSAGSSPRMWGTRSNMNLVMLSTRFIPTHVGNTPGDAATSTIHTVHPHACGEHDK